MKNEEKQHFRSSGVLTLFGLLGLSAGIVATPWNKAMQDVGVDECRQKAEVVGYQVAQIFREASRNKENKHLSEGREPASLGPVGLENTRTTGTMGFDPWGQPYRYRILASDSSQVRILVWSSGPNLKIETADLDDETKPLTKQPSYSGDDIGVVLSVSQN